MRKNRIVSPEKAGYVANLNLNDSQILQELDVMQEDKRRLSSYSHEAPEGEEINATEQISLQQLVELRRKFDEADTDQGGALELEEFVKAFGSVLGPNLTHRELVQMFMRIDANSDGSIDWEEFMNYMLLENQSLSVMRSEHCEYYNPKIPDSAMPLRMNGHRDMITGLKILAPSRSSEHPRYVTSSRDGTVKIWNANNLNLMGTVTGTNSWVTSLAHIDRCERLAVGNTNRSVMFYDLMRGHDFISSPVSLISDLKGVPTTMEYLRDSNMLLTGDDQGYLYQYKFSEDNWHICNTKMDCHRNDLLDLQSNQLNEYETTHRSKKHNWKELNLKNMKVSSHVCDKVSINMTSVHSDTITRIEFIPEMDALISSSLDCTIRKFDLEKFKDREVFRHHKKGVLSFVWCQDFKFIGSCGEERHITLWNPYSKKAINNLLHGHNSAVIDLAINTDKFQLISLGIDKVIKVWDIRNFRCIQTIVDKTSYRPENSLTGVHYNPSINSLLLTSRKINVWPFKAQEEMSSSHDCAVTKCLYNDNFSSIISTDENSNVNVWSILDGRLNFKYGEAHGTNRISAISFDFSGRRLITGGHDGSLKMWNFSNGQCLKDFNYDVEPKEVSGIIYIDEESGTRYNFIATVGWDKKIYIWPDENEPVVSWIKALPKEGQKGHTDDILCVEYCKEQKFLVSGGLTGQLFVWMFETGVVRAKLHEKDHSCLPVEDSAAEGKSVEYIGSLQQRSLLLTVTADGSLRFWDLSDLALTSKVKLAHLGKDAVTCAAKSKDGMKLASCDESGNLKLSDISNVHRPVDIFFVNAHSALINCVDLFYQSDSDKEFIITGSVDRNVKLFTIRGELLGYFGQGKHWDLNDTECLTMAPPPTHPPIFLRKKWRDKRNTSDSISDEELTEESKEDDLSAMKAYFIRQSVRKGEAKASEAGTFRKIDLSRLGVEKLPQNVEDLYKQKTGLDLRRERPHHKQRLV
mmetsp:Transcript_26608/g.47841  ORF Transcript_26608/g.47841 Transcript_26608/m.47841 type:complete len:974 (+) Transcript_26608:2642-5563(+)